VVDIAIATVLKCEFVALCWILTKLLSLDICSHPRQDPTAFPNDMGVPMTDTASAVLTNSRVKRHQTNSVARHTFSKPLLADES
jgi:hypothetical protein